MIIVASLGLPVYKHLLTPRSKALHLCFRNLRGRMDAIYDMTIGYSDTVCVEGGKLSRLEAPPLTCNYGVLITLLLATCIGIARGSHWKTRSFKAKFQRYSSLEKSFLF